MNFFLLCFALSCICVSPFDVVVHTHGIVYFFLFCDIGIIHLKKRRIRRREDVFVKIENLKCLFVCLSVNCVKRDKEIKMFEILKNYYVFLCIFVLENVCEREKFFHVNVCIIYRSVLLLSSSFFSVTFFFSESIFFCCLLQTFYL